MANMAMEKTPMPEQAADIRNKNFEEVTRIYGRNGCKRGKKMS